MIPRETLHELVNLRDRVQLLEREIVDMKTLNRDELNALRKAYGVTIGEARVLRVMARGGIISNDQICDAYCDGDKNPLLARDAVKRLRKRLPDIKIRSHYGFGYEIEDDSLKAVRLVMKAKC